MITKELIELCKRERWRREKQGHGDVQEELAFGEIIEKLEEHNEMKKGIHEINQIVKILKKG